MQTCWHTGMTTTCLFSRLGALSCITTNNTSWTSTALHATRDARASSGWVPCSVPLHPKEGREGGRQLSVWSCGEGLQQDEALASRVAWSAVDVQLVLLVVIQERAPSLENR